MDPPEWRKKIDKMLNVMYEMYTINGPGRTRDAAVAINLIGNPLKRVAFVVRDASVVRVGNAFGFKGGFGLASGTINTVS